MKLKSFKKASWDVISAEVRSVASRDMPYTFETLAIQGPHNGVIEVRIYVQFLTFSRMLSKDRGCRLRSTDPLS
jgi:hypothetical protein